MRLLRRWLPGIAVAVFLLHAANYLYYYVDDEAIPFVYARNLLRGRGLVYSALEGRVEGYSDFLMIFVDAVTYQLVRLAHLPLYAVFAGGELISLPCGGAIVWLVARFLRRNYRTSAALAGTAFVVLAGPLAVWSCSSLEAVPLALLVVVLLFSLLDSQWRRARNAAILVLLLRIDGPVYVAAAVAAGLVACVPGDRRVILRRVVIPVLVASALYHLWRVLYFHQLLTAPLQAKVLYKFAGPAHAAIKEPASNYLVRFIRLYGWGFLVPATFGWTLVRWTRRAVGIALATAMLCAYFAVVSDWMFGFRFFVSIVPLVAILVAEAVEGVGRRSRSLAAIAAAASLVWTTHTAVVFSRGFEEIEQDPNFFRSPTRDPGRFFSPWWSAYAALRDRVAPGTLIAYNQAGFVPFMLDADNIDTLGICSRFYAALPTQDVFYSEVGRYSPLTNKDVYSAGVAYLLNRRPAYLIERRDLLEKANAGVPRELLGGYYRRLWYDESNAVYVPTPKDASAFRRDPTLFLENVAHIARVSRATENGGEVLPREFNDRFPFLHEQSARLTISRTYSLDLTFETGPVPVYEVHIEHLRSAVPAVVAVRLWSAEGVSVWDERLALAQWQDSGLHVRMPRPVGAARATLEIAGDSDAPFKFDIGDLRVQAQPPELARYIAAHVAFGE